MIGIIDVGGGLRGIYGAGVLDYCMDNGISFDYCAGVSAGAANLCSYLAGQRGRNYHFYTEYAFRKEYMSLKSFLKSGSYINLEYVYGTLSNRDGENPLDYEAMKNCGKIFKIVATNARTGRPKYFNLKDLKQDDYGPVKASSCVPIVNRPYVIGGVPYFDGGLTDPIPVRKALKDGCEKVVVVLTRPVDFYRNPKKDVRMARLLLKSYPNSARALARRSAYYNRSLELCKEYQRDGKVLIVAPADIGGMSTLTRNQEAIEMMYREGLKDARAIESFL
ncbi:MAG: patatin family protein [Blautia sp.]|nr:patatin family protein [Blautia sp.]